MATRKIDLDEVYGSFIEAMLWSSHDETGESEYLDANYGESDIAPKCKAVIKKRIKKFVQENKKIIDELEISEEMVGHDLWLDTAGHGVGFWDRGYGKKGDKLSKSAKKFFSDETVEVGDDGKIWLLGSCSGD
jgi:hypothetical protein